MKLFNGKKTYITGIGFILNGITPIFTDEGIDLSKLDIDSILMGVGFITTRHAIAKK